PPAGRPLFPKAFRYIGYSRIRCQNSLFNAVVSIDAIVHISRSGNQSVPSKSGLLGTAGEKKIQLVMLITDPTSCCSENTYHRSTRRERGERFRTSDPVFGTIIRMLIAITKAGTAKQGGHKSS